MEGGGERVAYNFSSVTRNRNHRFPMTLSRRRDFLIKSVASSRLKYVLCVLCSRKKERKKKINEKQEKKGKRRNPDR